MICLEKVNKSYRMGENSLHVLKDVSLQVERGEFVSILGASGSGKSTLMNIIGCMDTLNTGRYTIDGIPVEQSEPDVLATIRNQKIGFIFQKYHLIPKYSVLQNVMMPLLVRQLLPEAGLQIFVLAIASASLSTATAIYHIAVSAIAEDLPGRKASRPAWLAGIIFCVLLSGGCAQIKGQLIALLCTTSWSIVGATVLVAYVALVRFGKRSSLAAWLSCACGFTACLAWYLLSHEGFSAFVYSLASPEAAVSSVTPVLTVLLGETAARIPPLFVGFACSLAGWFAGWACDATGRKHSNFWPTTQF